MYFCEFDKPGKGLVTIDLDCVTHFYELPEPQRTEVFLRGGSSIELEVSYQNFQRQMRQREGHGDWRN